MPTDELDKIPRNEVGDREYGLEQLHRMVYIMTRINPPDARNVATTGLRALDLDEAMADIRAWHWYANWTNRIRERSAT